jgi:hypothetical protein
MTHARIRYRSTAGLVLLAVAAYAAGAGCLSGCAQQGPPPNQIQQTIVGRETYTGLLAALNSAHRLGYLSDEDKAAIEPIRRAAAVGLDKMEAAALAGKGPDYESALAGFNAALVELARWRIQADRTAAAVEQTRAARPKAAAAPAPPPAAPAAAPKR